MTDRVVIVASDPAERSKRPDFSGIVAVSLEMQRAMVLARRAADLNLPILIEGEPGTGKELIARAIHAASPQSAGPFIVMRNGGAEQTLDPGTENGDANLSDRAWRKARRGVLFVENIDDLNLPAQERLAALLIAAGTGLEDVSDACLICTSSKNLIDRVKKGQFREDLYYRINVFPIWLPPLRDRVEDIPALSRHFLAQVIAEQGKRIEEIDEAALTLLKSYAWPGNVHQLENAIFRGVVLAEGDRLTVQEFPQIAAQVSGFRPNIPDMPAFLPKLLYQGPAIYGGHMPSIQSIALAPTANGATIGIPALNEDGEIRRLDDIEADLIRLALGHYRGHITEVARRLGIGRSTLYRKMREFGLEVRHN